MQVKTLSFGGNIVAVFVGMGFAAVQAVVD